MEGKESDASTIVTKEEEEEWDTYTSGEFGISIAYPAEWIKSEGQMGTAVAFVHPLDQMTSVNLLVQPLPEGAEYTDLEEFTKKSVDQMIEMMGGEKFDVEDGTLFKQKAKRMNFSTPFGAMTIKVFQTWTLKDGKAFILTYSSPGETHDELRPIVEKMLESADWAPIVPVAERPIQVLFLKVHENKEHLFRIRYPNNWVVKEAKGFGPALTVEYTGGLTPRETEDYTLKLTLTVTPLPTTDFTLEKWSRVISNNLSDHIIGELAPPKEVTFGGQKGIQFRYTSDSAVKSGRTVQTFTLLNNKVFTFSAISTTPEGDNRPFPIFESVEKSFEFLPSETFDSQIDNLIYEHLVYKVGFTYHSGWMPAEGVMGTVVSFERGNNQTLKSNVNLVIAENDPTLKSLDDFGKVVKEQLTMAEESKIEQEADTDVGGEKGKRIVYTGVIGGKRFMFEQLFTLRNEKAYIISFSSLEEDFTVERRRGDRLLKSFRFLD
eukprot:TRINITY_DN4604_c0_g1_i1.p1 TRINITY_DN4604_c0_g1~~TRINITY_DN4604_c0_g1_i1.p1  ORF type:complete len:491 (+),score=138.32 TRINITY_DN4604_c0_g1_i1:117-1589(+)